MTRDDAAESATDGFVGGALRRPAYRLIEAVAREGGGEWSLRVEFAATWAGGGRAGAAASTAGRLTRELAVGIGGCTTRGGW